MGSVKQNSWDGVATAPLLLSYFPPYHTTTYALTVPRITTAAKAAFRNNTI